MRARCGALAASGLPGRVVPTFRLDRYLDPDAVGFAENVRRLPARLRMAPHSRHPGPIGAPRTITKYNMSMIIDKAEVIVSPDRNFVTSKITTADGLTGIGDATLNGHEFAVVAYLREYVVPLLIVESISRNHQINPAATGSCYAMSCVRFVTACPRTSRMNVADWSIASKTSPLK